MKKHAKNAGMFGFGEQLSLYRLSCIVHRVVAFSAYMIVYNYSLIKVTFVTFVNEKITYNM